VQFGFPSQFTQNIARFAALGVQVRITELDVRIQLPADANEINTQNSYYTQVVDGCMNNTACAGVTIWGFTDKYSWVPDTFNGEGQALIYDASYNQKGAYTAVHNALDDGDPVDPTPPSTPTGLTASGVTSNSVNLSWTASTDNVGVTGYDIIRNGAVTNTVPGTSTTVTGLTPSTAYEFAVRARDAAGNTSANSTPVSVTTLAGPGPGGCTATATVQTQWNNGYVVQPVTITNSGTAPITGWTVAFTLPSGHSLTGQWNATISPTSGALTARSMNYNGNLGPGQSTTFGFQVSRPNGNTAVPSGYTCTVS
jgi:endo-1,4-beta-xylanase